MDIVTVYNPFDTDFSQAFDGKIYKIPSFGTLLVIREAGFHIARHIAQRELNNRLIADNKKYYTGEDVIALAKTYISDVDGVVPRAATPIPAPTTAPVVEVETVTKEIPLEAPAPVEPPTETPLPTQVEKVEADPVFAKAAKK